jgi:hypothetical protein
MCPPDGAVRILSRDLPKSMNGIAVVTREGFIGAAEKFLGWFDKEEMRLQSGSG